MLRQNAGGLSAHQFARIPRRPCGTDDEVQPCTWGVDEPSGGIGDVHRPCNALLLCRLADAPRIAPRLAVAFSYSRGKPAPLPSPWPPMVAGFHCGNLALSRSAILRPCLRPCRQLGAVGCDQEVLVHGACSIGGRGRGRRCVRRRWAAHVDLNQWCVRPCPTRLQAKMGPAVSGLTGAYATATAACRLAWSVPRAASATRRPINCDSPRAGSGAALNALTASAPWRVARVAATELSRVVRPAVRAACKYRPSPRRP